MMLRMYLLVGPSIGDLSSDTATLSALLAHVQARTQPHPI